MFLDGAEVAVSCPELYFTSQTYFTDSISVSKKICRFTCYDRMCKLDKTFDTSLNSFDKDGTVSSGGVISTVCYMCGFTNYGCSSADGLELIRVSKSQLENITCRRALELVSEVMCGTWLCTENTLYLACLGDGNYGDYAFVEDYTEIDFQGRTKITTLVMTNSETGESFNFGGTENGAVIEIESPFASAELGLCVWRRIENYIHVGWRCDKADVAYDSTLKNMSSLIVERADAKGEWLLATNSEFTADSTGIYFSGGADPYNEWNYRDYLERRKLSIGKNVGNTTISENGDIIFRNLNKGGGLSEQDNGISVYVSKN